MTRPRLAALAAVTALVTASLGGAAAVAGSTSKHISYKAHWASPTDKFNTLPPCDPVTFKSPTGVCRGTATGHGAYIGSWKGRFQYEYGWLYPSSGFTYIQDLETVTGTVRGCGRGTLTYRLSGTITPTGRFTGTMSVIRALGTGRLKGASGGGTFSGAVKPDFSNSGTVRGQLTCPHRPQENRHWHDEGVLLPPG